MCNMISHIKTTAVSWNPHTLPVGWGIMVQPLRKSFAIPQKLKYRNARIPFLVYTQKNTQNKIQINTCT